jgi:RNA polymerase-binding transcription factor DksA
MVDWFNKPDTAKLNEEREQTLLSLIHLREALKIEVGPPLDQKDPNLKEHEMVLAQIRILEHKLEWLDDALQQAKQGTYGLCKRCGEPIDPARLEVLPETTLCFECKTILERQLRTQAMVTQSQFHPTGRLRRHYRAIDYRHRNVGVLRRTSR